MKRGIIAALAGLACWCGGASLAQAQFIAPGFAGPGIGSPFFPLGGGTMRTHPFGPIQMMPQNPALVDLQQSINQINTQGSLRGQLDAMGANANAATALTTGHPTTYFNTGHYYPPTFLPGGSNVSSNTGFGSGANLANGAGYNPEAAGIGGFGLGAGGFFGAGFGAGFGGGRGFNSGTFGPGIR